MAETETITILKVGTETGEAVKSVNDLRENIKLLKKGLDTLEIGTEEYQNTLEELKVNQTALKNAMYATTASLEDVTKAATGTGESYNALVARMAAAKEELRATDVSTKEGMERFKQLAAQINATNDRLKAMDAAQGNFQRNVGMYTTKISKMGDSFRATAGGAGSMIAPINGASMAMKVLATTPVIGILGLLANVINKVTGNLESSEENFRAVQASMASLKPIGDLVTKAMQALGKAVAWVAEKVSALFKKLLPDLVKEESAVVELTQKEFELQDKKREYLVANAKDENKIAELRAKAADKEKVSAEERIKLLKQAGDLELEISKRQKDLAEREYEIAVLNSQRAANSKEENDALAEAEANKIKAETEYFKKKKEINAAISAASAEIKSAAKSEATATATKTKEQVKSEVNALKSRKELLEDQLKSVKHYSEEEKKVKKDLIEATYEFEKAQAEKTITDAEEKAAALLTIEAKHRRELREYDEWENQRDYEAERLRLSNELLALEGDSMARLEKNIELKQFELDSLHQLENESDEEFRARQLQKEKEYRDTKAALVKQYITNVTSIAQSTAGLLSAVADAYSDEVKAQQNAGKISQAEAEKRFQQVKAMQITVATINMLAGIATALSGTFTTKSGPWDIALAVVQAATIAATGTANIVKIKNSNLGSSASASTSASAPAAATSAIVSAPSIPTNIPQVSNLTTASDEERLNQMVSDQRVYILSSDIEASNDQRRVQVAETSF